MNVEEYIKLLKELKERQYEIRSRQDEIEKKLDGCSDGKTITLTLHGYGQGDLEAHQDLLRVLELETAKIMAAIEHIKQRPAWK